MRAVAAVVNLGAVALGGLVGNAVATTDQPVKRIIVSLKPSAEQHPTQGRKLSADSTNALEILLRDAINKGLSAATTPTVGLNNTFTNAHNMKRILS